MMTSTCNDSGDGDASVSGCTVYVAPFFVAHVHVPAADPAVTVTGTCLDEPATVSATFTPLPFAAHGESRTHMAKERELAPPRPGGARGAGHSAPRNATGGRVAGLREVQAAALGVRPRRPVRGFVPTACRRR